MNINFTLLDESNFEKFENVLPPAFENSDNRICLGAYEDSGSILGAVSYQLINYEYIIEWLYVDQEFRRNGVGMGLINEVIRTIISTGDIYPVSAKFEYSDSDSAMHTFFLSCKQMITEYSHDRYHVTSGDIKNSAALHKGVTQDVKTEYFFDRPVDEQKQILSKLSIEGIYSVHDYETFKKECVQELCRCVFVKNNLVDLIIMQKLPSGNLELSYLYGKYPQGLFKLLSLTVSDMERLFPDVTLFFEAVNEESKQLADRIFPKAEKVHIYEASF